MSDYPILSQLTPHLGREDAVDGAHELRLRRVCAPLVAGVSSKFTLPGLTGAASLPFAPTMSVPVAWLLRSTGMPYAALSRITTEQ